MVAFHRILIRNGVTVVVGLLATLLVTTAVLKLGGANGSTLPTMGLLSTPIVQQTVAVWELTLAAWLVSRVVSVWSWSVAVATFGSFAVVSGYLTWKGVSDCGCFGTIKANPLVAFLIDLTALILLAVARPRCVPKAVWAADGRRLAPVAMGVGSMVAAVAIYGQIVYGSPVAAVAALRGDEVSWQQSVDFGTTSPGGITTRVVRVINLSASQLTIVGGTSDCSCAALQSLPIHIPPGSSGEVTIDLRAPATAGVFTRTAMLRTDSRSAPVLGVTLSVEVNLSTPVLEVK